MRPSLPREIEDGKFIKCVSCKDNKIFISLDGQPMVLGAEDIKTDIKMA